jgi:hypothetical protein
VTSSTLVIPAGFTPAAAKSFFTAVMEGPSQMQVVFPVDLSTKARSSLHGPPQEAR